MSKLKLLIFILIFSFPAQTLAAELSMTADKKEITPQTKTEISFWLNTGEEEINALEGKLVFNQDFLSVAEIDDANSIVSFWLDRPQVKNNSIIFSGIIPGGLWGKKELLFKITMLGKKEGVAGLFWRDIKILKNDGQGSEDLVLAKDGQIIISAAAPLPPPDEEIVKAKVDSEPPEGFQPAVSSSQILFAGQNFLIFDTKDKGVGVEKFFVKETKWKFLSFLVPWQEAASPFVLKDQNLRSFVFVKAVDKKGNERLEILSPQNRVWYESFWFYGIIILIIVLLLLGKKLWREKR
jgi:hypothetical protein